MKTISRAATTEPYTVADLRGHLSAGSESEEEMTMAVELKEGDVYGFSYSPEAWKRADGRDLNWAFDGQVVVRNGVLCDTYWGFSGACEPRVVKPEDGELTFKCNLNDVRDIREYETRHYAAEDVFNLSYNHHCNKRFVVKKAATISGTRMLEEIRKKEQAIREEMERVIRHSATDLVQLGELRARIESGDLSKHPWW